jgi:hypothetical protein
LRGLLFLIINGLLLAPLAYGAGINIADISAPSQSGLRRAQLRAPVAAQLSQMQACFNDMGAQLKGRYGSISFNVIINDKGQVTKANTLSNSSQNNALAFCLMNKLSVAVFPAPKQGESTPIYLKLNYELDNKAAIFQAPSPYVSIVIENLERAFLNFNGRWFVEALRGKEYTVRLYNPFDVRLAIALVVDGVNTIDGKTNAPEDGRKWVIRPGQLVDIRGWQVAPTKLRRFVFTSEAQSLGAQLGQKNNVGFIQAVGFKERAFYDPKSKLKTTHGLEQTKMVKVSDIGKPSDAEGKGGPQGTAESNNVKGVDLALEPNPSFTVQIKYDTRNALQKAGVIKVGDTIPAGTETKPSPASESYVPEMTK